MVTNRHHGSHRLLLLVMHTIAEPPSTSINGTNKQHGSSSSYTNEANFDTNMVIILAALLCALICALGLNSIVRCALRCGRRIAFETPDETAARLAGTGLKKRALRQIPVVVYGSAGASGIPATECPICLGEFVGGEKLKVLPKCKHGFHARCVDTWLMSHSSCPTCRHSLLEKPPATAAPAPAPEDVGDDGDVGGIRTQANGPTSHGGMVVIVHDGS